MLMKLDSCTLWFLLLCTHLGFCQNGFISYVWENGTELTTDEITKVLSYNENIVLLILDANKYEAVGYQAPLPAMATKVSSTTVSCDCEDYKVTIIILSIFLAAVTIGLITAIVVTLVIKNRARLLPTIPIYKTNGFQVRGEMAEIQRVSRDLSPVALHRRSVSFNDTVEEINVVRL